MLACVCLINMFAHCASTLPVDFSTEHRGGLSHLCVRVQIILACISSVRSKCQMRIFSLLFFYFGPHDINALYVYALILQGKCYNALGQNEAALNEFSLVIQNFPIEAPGMCLIRTQQR